MHGYMHIWDETRNKYRDSNTTAASNYHNKEKENTANDSWYFEGTKAIMKAAVFVGGLLSLECKDAVAC